MPREVDKGPKYYIIEHPWRGMLTEVTFDKGKVYPSFTWFSKRSGPSILRFERLYDAIRMVEEFGNCGWRGTHHLNIRKSPRFLKRCTECRAWINDHVISRGDVGHRTSCSQYKEPTSY